MSPRPRATSDSDILAATYRVVSRQGPNLTLADVAREAGISPATLVQRFGSKRGLLLAFAGEGAKGMPEQFKSIRGASRSALAAVYATADCMAAMAETPETLVQQPRVPSDRPDRSRVPQARARPLARHARGVEGAPG